MEAQTVICWMEEFLEVSPISAAKILWSRGIEMEAINLVRGNPYYGSDLHDAVNMNDEKRLLAILQSGEVDVNLPGKMRCPALVEAAERGYFGILKILIDYGAEIEYADGVGRNSFMMACYAGHLKIAQYLKEKGASFDSRDLNGLTPMHWAATGGHLDILRWLIANGCEIDPVDDSLKKTPLMRVAMLSGNVEVAKCLIEGGADINAQDTIGLTALTTAVSRNFESMVSLLLENGADCNIKSKAGSSPLSIANENPRMLNIFERWRQNLQ
ncbi:fibronectin type 3 and ankyrin repeat domains protein 1 [Discoglossus pictus]